jgi:uncharacterized membrane protein
MFGFSSLRDIEIVLSGFLNKNNIKFLVVCLLLLSAFGVYIGRFLRWNSWDILCSPLDLGADIIYRVIHPFRYIHTWVITLLVGILLNMMYFSRVILKK